MAAHIFRIHPGDCPLYWDVRVYPTRRQMRAGYRRLDPANRPDDTFAAIVMPLVTWTTAEAKTPEPSLGHVLFTKEKLDSEIVAHEAVHMATSYMRRRRWRLRLTSEIDDHEERLAYLIGRCAALVANELHEIGAW